MEFDELKDQYIDKLDIKSAFLGTLPSDPPLLSELGIDFTTIKKESNLIFKIFKSTEISYDFIRNADITGPIIFLLLYSFFLLINCKVHFGYVYIISLFSLFSTYILLNILSNIKMLEVCSVLGYSFIPVVFYSGLSFVINRINVFYKIGIGILFSGWSAYTSALSFSKYLGMENKQVVVGYPMVLTYFCFCMIVIF